ncbi:hypothetical protein FRC17_009908 [Serendipita sp. 399]|nr:hypothetical protein FRC17_009908 [Serendipita sp. 399]
MAQIPILYDEDTLLHHSLELIGHKLIDAHESPDRILRIFAAMEHSTSFINLVKIQCSEDSVMSQISLSNVHSKEYIEHLKTIFDRFLSAGAVEESGCILPECFPHHSLLHTKPQAPHDKIGSSSAETSAQLKSFRLPKDPFSHLGYYSFDLSSGMSKDTFKSALAAVNLALKGVDLLLEGSHPVAFALTRPPGHHSCRSLAGGYCYFNNAAIAADYLLEKLGPFSGPDRGQSRVVILDLDFHHGNGTQSLTYDKREPAYISIHGEDEYPYYTGAADEKGIGEGEGYNCNLPLAARPNSTRDDYLSALNSAIDIIQTKWRPAYLLVSIGFDTFRKDPLGAFELDVDDYKRIGMYIRSLHVPILLLLEGGYSDELGDLVIKLLEGLQSE